MDISLSMRDYKSKLIITGLALLLVTTTLFSFTVGAVDITLQEVSIILLKHLGFFSNTSVNDTYEAVMNTIRLPRIVMTLLIGAALGISGASLQGLFRNPLVEPSLIGVSGGSALAVVFAIVFGGSILPALPDWIYNSFISIVAFAGGSLATFFVLRLSIDSGRTNIAMLVLIGVAVNALTGAMMGLAIFYADENQLSTFMFWTLGDLGGATWSKLSLAAPLLVFSTFGLLFFVHHLNALALGESEAYHLGVNIEQIKRLVVFLSALAVGVSVSLAGIIGFIGLVVPHVIRTLVQSDNTFVLPASALGGALLLLAADIIARTIVSPAELPIGVVTALIGAPFFITLLLRAKRKQEI
jgi:iron complex transport system permease protein